MDRLVQLLFYQGDADCFFIAQPRCSLGRPRRFGIIAAPCCGTRIHCQASSLARRSCTSSSAVGQGLVLDKRIRVKLKRRMSDLSGREAGQTVMSK